MQIREIIKQVKPSKIPDEPQNFFEALRRGKYDPVFFAKYFCGIEPFEGFDLEKNPKLQPGGARTALRGQVAWLTQGLDKPERILSTANRFGKSIIEAIRHLWWLIYKIRRNPKFDKIFEYRTINIAITMEQAKIVWEEAIKIINSRPQLSWAVERITRKPFPLLILSNGQIFTCRSTDQPANLWGPWYDNASYDEAACEKNPDTTIPLIKTRLMDHDGQIDYLSTPAYTKNWFFQLKTKAKLDPKNYYLLTGYQQENPYVSEEARQRFIEGMTKDQVRVHIYGDDVEAGGLVFKHADIEAARHPELQLIEHIEGELYIHEHRQFGHRYVDGWDIATKRDKLVGITIDVTSKPYKLVMLERYCKIPWSYVYDRILTRQRIYGSTQFIDTTGVGDHLPEELSEIIDFIVPINFAKPKLKTQVIIAGQKALEDKLVIFPHIPPLIQQLTFYEWDDKDLETDCVIAICLALFSPDVQTQVSTSSALDIKTDVKTKSAEMAEEISTTLRGA